MTDPKGRAENHHRAMQFLTMTRSPRASRTGHHPLFRFVGDRADDSVRSLLTSLDRGGVPLVAPQQPGLFDSAQEKNVV
jgi:hypothetical protein